MSYELIFNSNVAIAGACIGAIVGFALGLMCGMVIARMAQEFGTKIKLTNES